MNSTGSINGMTYTYSVLLPTSNSSIINATVLCGYKNNKFVIFGSDTENVSAFSNISPKINEATLLNYISTDLT